MPHNQRLQWVQRNRAKTDRAQLVRGSIERFVEEVMAAGDEAAEAASAVAAVVDDDFRVHCRIAAAGNGRLMINVDEAGLVYSMRRRWQSPVHKALSEGRLRGGISRVMFAFGTVGISVEPRERAT